MSSNKVQNALNDTIRKAIKRSERESKKRDKSPYFVAFNTFEQDLDLLRQLNKKLPKSAEETMIKEWKKSVKKLGRSKKQALKEIRRLFSLVTSNLNEAKKGVKKTPINIKVNMSEKAQNAFGEMIMAYSYSSGLNKFVRNMSLVYLIAEFESFLRSVLQTTYKAKPEVLMYCQKIMTYGELIASSNIDDIKQQIMDKESSAIINQDIEEVSQYLEQKFHLDLAKSKDWKKLKERFYRRNVLVHNSGMINRLYKLRTGYTGKDKVLLVTENYLKDSINLFDRTAMEISEHFYGKFK